MAEKKTAPKLRIEDTEAEQAFRDAPAGEQAGGAAPVATGATDDAAGSRGSHGEAGSAKAPRSHSLSGALSSLRQWLTNTFPGHENAVAFGFLGLIIAILIFVIGFWRTLLIALIVVLGVAVGQVFDGDPKIFNAIRKLIRDNQG